MAGDRPASSSGSPGAPADWVHRTPHGVVFGGSRPDKPSSGLLRQLGEALALTWQLRQTLWVLSLKDFKSRYRAQALGMFWSFAYPLVMMVTVTIAFEYILKIQREHFPVFYLIAAIFWQFFTNATLATTGSMIDNAALVKRTTFPRFLVVVAAVISHLINFCMEYVMVFGFFFVFPDAYNFSYTLIALPFITLLMVFICIGVGLLTSCLNVRYRDVYYIVTSALTMGFWVCPILYSTADAPPWLRGFLRANPLAGVMEGARDIIMKGEWPNAAYLVPALVAAVVLFFGGCYVFHRQNLRVADYV